MSIKPIEEIPQNKAEQRKSYRQQIKNDVQEAIDKGILKFEFDGDYNYRYLAQYAREEMRMLFAPIHREILKKVKEEYGVQHISFSPTAYDAWKKYIKITARKEEDRTHVYCEIIPEGLETVKKDIEAIAEIDRIEESAEKMFYAGKTKNYLEHRHVLDIAKKYRRIVKERNLPIDETLLKKIYEETPFPER